jgi:hypothetical protein
MVSVLTIIASLSALIALRVVDLNKVSSFADTIFKIIAVLAGMIWTLNRYFVQRTDAAQFRVDCDIRIVRGVETDGPSLLIFRLDLVTTGNVLISGYKHFVRIDSVSATDSGVERNQIYRWPPEDWHPGGVIEPRSWAAINDELSCPASVRAARVFLAVGLDEENQWTWHKTFDVSEDSK